MVNIISILFTVKTDIFNKSNNIILFKTRNTYIGFTVLESTSEYNRRAIAWFYRNYDSPNIKEWNLFKTKFKLESIPFHRLSLYDKNKNNTNEYIDIYEITNEYIRYSYNNNKIITLLIESGSLLPDQYVYNYTVNST